LTFEEALGLFVCPIAEVKVNIMRFPKVTEGAVASARVAVPAFLTSMPARLLLRVTWFDREWGRRGQMVGEIVSPVVTPVTATAALIRLVSAGKGIIDTTSEIFSTCFGLDLRFAAHAFSFKNSVR
jgi:hypothetical protein